MSTEPNEPEALGVHLRRLIVVLVLTGMAFALLTGVWNV